MIRRISALTPTHGHVAYLLATLFAFSATGCVVVDDNGDVIVEDALVQWTIDGEEGSELCDEFAVDLWEVSVTGPEQAVIEVSCDSVWDTGGELRGAKALAIGDYTVRISAFDGTDQLVARFGPYPFSISDLDAISPDVLDIDLDSNDFP